LGVPIGVNGTAGIKLPCTAVTGTPGGGSKKVKCPHVNPPADGTVKIEVIPPVVSTAPVVKSKRSAPMPPVIRAGIRFHANINKPTIFNGIVVGLIQPVHPSTPWYTRLVDTEITDARLTTIKIHAPKKMSATGENIGRFNRGNKKITLAAAFKPIINAREFISLTRTIGLPAETFGAIGESEDTGIESHPMAYATPYATRVKKITK